jgi:hypothetical protein
MSAPQKGETNMIPAILITIALSLPAGALVTSFVEYRKQYNLWDLIKDKIAAFRGKIVYDKQVTIKTTQADLHKVEAAILGMPDRIKAAIRRRV